MTTTAEASITAQPIAAAESEIIRAGRKIATEAVSISMTPSAAYPTTPSITPISALPGSAAFFPSLPTTGYEQEEPVSIILNIESSGFLPWEQQIICIGLQDPQDPTAEPTIIMEQSEANMLMSLFDHIKSNAIERLIGYAVSFDFRFIMLRAMKHNIPCKEFMDCDLYDLMEMMTKGKDEYVYMAQKAPKLSVLGDFFWGYPKPFTDLEMLKYWKSGRYDKVVEFASSQVTRTLALFLLYKYISTTPFTLTPITTVSGVAINSASQPDNVLAPLANTETIPPRSITWQCPNCLAELEVLGDQAPGACTICGGELIRK